MSGSTITDLASIPTCTTVGNCLNLDGEGLPAEHTGGPVAGRPLEPVTCDSPIPERVGDSMAHEQEGLGWRFALATRPEVRPELSSHLERLETRH